MADASAETMFLTVGASAKVPGSKPGKFDTKIGNITLTSNRLIFVEQEEDNTTAWLIGGLIGSLIASAFSSRKQKKPRPIIIINRDNIASYTTEVTGLFKNQLDILLQLKDGTSQSLNMPLKESEPWLEEINKNVVVTI